MTLFMTMTERAICAVRLPAALFVEAVGAALAAAAELEARRRAAAERRRVRDAIGRLDAHTLRDIGLEPDQACIHAGRD